MITYLVVIVLSYLIGSIPGALWTGRALHGVDVREHGSGNLGATNVFRVLGWKAGTLATVIDAGKGALAVGLAYWIRLGDLPAPPFWDPETVLALVAGLAAILGHNFPVWAGFKGGKGVNTSAGVLLALTPVSMLLTIGVFALVLFTSRYVSLASMTAAVAFPTTIALRKYVFGVERLDGSLLVLGTVMALSIIVMHRANIARLRAGTENRIRSFRPAKGRLGDDAA
jgi:glycerol-3-phosphate acyltransferase PlsY